MQAWLTTPNVVAMRDLLTTTPAEVVEADFAALQATIARAPALHSGQERDAVVYWSSTDLAALNVVADAHITPERVAARVPELLDPFFTRGWPFMWLTTPSSTTPQLEAALAQAGLRARELPAMYAPLRSGVDPHTPEDVYIDLAWPDQVSQVAPAVFNAFAGPVDPTDRVPDLLDGMDPASNQFFVARSLDNGRPLGVSTMHVRDSSAMLANVSTVSGPRERGIARALVATMMNRASSTGATSATTVVPHSTYQVYVDLGFRTQFDLVAWVWDPRL